MKKFVKQARKGFSLVELLIAVVVLGILGAMLLAAGTAAQTKARVAVASNDIDSVRNAVYTAFTMNTSFMQKKDAPETFQALVEAINAELDENWEWEPIGGTYPNTSGAIAQTKTQRDPWNNKYTLYCYTDAHTVSYSDTPDAAAGTGGAATYLEGADSCMYVVIASAGPNGTGVGQGYDGAAVTAADMVNNTDGIDDIGVVIRLLNGSTTMSTFGWASAGYGTLENCNWYFCGTKTDPAVTGAVKPAGIYTKLSGPAKVVTVDDADSSLMYASSIDSYPSAEYLPSLNRGQYIQLIPGAMPQG